MCQMLVHDENARFHRRHDIRLLQLDEKALLLLFWNMDNFLIIIDLGVSNSVAASIVSNTPILLLMTYRTYFERVNDGSKSTFGVTTGLSMRLASPKSMPIFGLMSKSKVGAKLFCPMALRTAECMMA